MLGDLREDRDYLLNDRLEQIAVPTLILWGNQDRILPVEHAGIWHASIAGSTLIVLPDCGHAPQFELPQQTAQRMLEFLAGRCDAQGCPPN